MIHSSEIKPISYFKSHASEIVRDVSKNQKTMIITQNGEAKAVLQDINVYEQTRETLALLKILAMGKKSIEKGEYQSVDDAFQDIRKRIERIKKNEK
ncbi:MAG: type II toxin-antitoxin system Phd/YefM family antitoxin [bacterium]